jgi:predicted DsbA family dithiol-disulfide isomerase
MNVEIWSDIACPWCYIGKRRFEAALDAFEHSDDVTVTWRSFELDPGAPAVREGERAAHLAAKYGVTVDEARAMEDRMAETAAADGLEFNFAIARGGNMRDAHRIVHLASGHDRQDAMKERLFRAYLTEGEVLSDHDTLTRLAVEVGLPEAEVREVLASGRYDAEVRDEERLGAALGITAVPFFVVDRAIGAAGAQPPQVLVDLLDQAWAQRSPVEVVTGGEACGPDGC